MAILTENPRKALLDGIMLQFVEGEIPRAKMEGFFRDLFDFVDLDCRFINKKTLEASNVVDLETFRQQRDGESKT